MVVDLYNGIYLTLSQDEEIVSLLEIDTSASPENIALEKAYKIQKRKQPQNIAEYIPMISFYTPGGDISSSNADVYNSVILFNIFTSDDVNKAHLIAQRIEELFDREIPEFANITTFESNWKDSYENTVDLENIYSFTSVVVFSISNQ